MGAFTPVGSPINIQAESAAATGGWQVRNNVAGASGSALHYTGANEYGASSGNSDLTFTVTVPASGQYQLDIRAMRNPEGRNIRGDLENDVWVGVNGAAPTKLFFHGAMGEWQSANTFETAHCVFEGSVLNLAAGTHTITIAGRSNGVYFDGFSLTPVTGP